MRKGLTLVYTGNGKGKTTAALGLALRAIGHGQRVFMIQFMKGSAEYGEIQAAQYLPHFTLVQKGLPTFVKKGDPGREDLRLAREGLELARQVIQAGEHELVILDEVNVAVDYGLLKAEDVLELIEIKPEGVTLVLTGRYASDKIMEKADMVSEVKDIKHHYRQGIPSQPGIEY
ncbi:cob(I)yrinic acid a,c-diamide adenosyltransferase [Thermanaeromonas toyohensis ToBE]|uniref:Cob(I)yrinic acid a,c-diamide adenosyltransferase n=1 Tax=Thermanaeromonas toyohensis ToBE TaxID=698762 RepID=A0A1W1VW95_9FIRM|nr:cob(I)yrinic acid a,c-diamide adenosyltransferase [Thermanaeromonas toyohensis]SMB97523.1 cob(I)yrinic acid a,c-diamide adenosyltransferase [Thermanaeromonas toyohensis ToBE]